MWQNVMCASMKNIRYIETGQLTTQWQDFHLIAKTKFPNFIGKYPMTILGMTDASQHPTLFHRHFDLRIVQAHMYISNLLPGLFLQFYNSWTTQTTGNRTVQLFVMSTPFLMPPIHRSRWERTSGHLDGSSSPWPPHGATEWNCASLLVPLSTWCAIHTVDDHLLEN